MVERVDGQVQGGLGCRTDRNTEAEGEKQETRELQVHVMDKRGYESLKHSRW